MSKELGDQGGVQQAEPAPTGPAVTPGKQTLEGETAQPMTGKAKVTHETDQETPDGTAKTRTTVAVGELVYFSAADVDAGTWSTTDGTGKANKLDYDWRAPSSPGSVTVTFTPTEAGAAPTTVTMKVIGPSSISYFDKKDQTYAKGTAGAGMLVKLEFLPLSAAGALGAAVEDDDDAHGRAASSTIVTARSAIHPTSTGTMRDRGRRSTIGDARRTSRGPRSIAASISAADVKRSSGRFAVARTMVSPNGPPVIDVGSGSGSGDVCSMNVS